MSEGVRGPGRPRKDGKPIQYKNPKADPADWTRAAREKKKAAREELLETNALIRDADLKLEMIPKIEPSSQGRKFDYKNPELQPALDEVLCAYRFAGLSLRQIEGKIGLSRPGLAKHLTKPEFLQKYSIYRGEMIGKMSESLSERIMEVAHAALAVKIELMNHSENDWLRAKMASDLLQFAMELARGRRDGNVDKLTAIWKKAMKKRMPDGSVVTETVTLRGQKPKEFVSDQGGSGENPGDFGEQGPEDRGEGPREITDGTGSSGD